METNKTGSGRHIQLSSRRYRGSGEPTIILENGLDAMFWSVVTMMRFKNISRTCLHVQAGMLLDPVTEPRRTTQDHVNDLPALLKQAGVPGPYILIGHSVAGFNMLSYTGQYPDDVVGIVCVDCRVPAFDAIFLDKLSGAAPGGSEDIKQALAEALSEQEKALAGGMGQVSEIEKLDFRASLGDRPVVVFVAEKTYWGVPEDVQLIIDESWLASQQKFSELSTHSRLEVVNSTDHETIVSSDSVMKAIQEVYDMVKKPK